MHSSQRTAALAFAALSVTALAGCVPGFEPTPEPTPQPAATQPTVPEPTTQPPEASTPVSTPEVTLGEMDPWAGMTSHCDSVGRLMRVDDHPQPLVNGYAPVDLHDSGPREGARGEVLTMMDGSPNGYIVAEGDELMSIGRRFCAPDPDYVAWLNHHDSANDMTLRPGLPIMLVSTDPPEGEAGPAPTDAGH